MKNQTLNDKIGVWGVGKRKMSNITGAELEADPGVMASKNTLDRLQAELVDIRDNQLPYWVDTVNKQLAQESAQHWDNVGGNASDPNYIKAMASVSARGAAREAKIKELKARQTTLETSLIPNAAKSYADAKTAVIENEIKLIKAQAEANPDVAKQADLQKQVDDLVKQKADVQTSLAATIPVAATSNNKTLWIVLGVVGGLALIIGVVIYLKKS